MPESIAQDKKALDERAMQIVSAALTRLGGVGDLVRGRKADMLPALMESAYILVLQQEGNKSVDEIAEMLDLPRSAVRSVLDAPTTSFEERLRYEVDGMHPTEAHTDPEWSEMPSSAHLEPEHLTGALAKMTYTQIRREEGSVKSWPG